MIHRPRKLTDPGNSLVDPRSAHNGRLSTGLEIPQIVHAPQVPRLESRTVDNNLGRSRFSPDPERRLSNMRQLAVLNMSSCLLELVEEELEIYVWGDDGGFVGVSDWECCVCRGDRFELDEREVQEGEGTSVPILIDLVRDNVLIARSCVDI